jgi:hypothetical protein
MDLLRRWGASPPAASKVRRFLSKENGPTRPWSNAMTKKSATPRQQRSADAPKNAPPPKADAHPTRAAAAPPDHQWREHEHSSETTNLEADKLVQSTGSPELAKHAVDQMQARADAAPPHEQTADQDAAARELGFDSFDALVKASVAFPVERGRTFFVCELSDGRWIRFDRDTWPRHDAFRTRDEAMHLQKQEPEP